MGLFDKLRGELIDIIEWLDESRDTMVYRFPRYENEIKYGAKLVVRESQAAAFINEGKLADVYQPGTYTLETQNMPILSTLRGWKYGFNSPFKAEVYFVTTRVFTGWKWRTKNPIMLRDPEFGPIRLRAFGTFGIKIADPATFIRQVAGTDSRFTLDELGDQIRDLVTARFSEVLGQSKVPALDLAGNQDKLGAVIVEKIKNDFATFGLQVVVLTVENISLPPEVEAAMDKRTSMGIIGNLDAFAKFQAASAMETAAANPNGGLAGAGMSAALGVAMASQMSQSLQPSNTPPPLPQTAVWFAALNGAQAGPFDLPALQQHIQAGKITPQTLVWKNGLANWTPAGQVPELSNLFAAVPPPLPPL